VEVEKPCISEPDRELLDKMLAACKEYDVTAMEELLLEMEKYSYKSGGELIVWLRQRVNDLDYEAIQKRLERLD
jgi:hypothetical protein